MVISFFSSPNVSSILAVEIGSSPEQGSSNSKTLGFRARALAIQSLCCCPPESFKAGESSLSLTSSHNPACTRLSSTLLLNSLFDSPAIFGPYSTFSLMLMGKATGRANIIPTDRLKLWIFCVFKMSISPMNTLPEILADGIVSIILFKTVSRVVFPEVVGPIIPNISFFSIDKERSPIACFLPYKTERCSMLISFTIFYFS